MIGAGYSGTTDPPPLQGSSIAISADGNTMALGGYNDNNGSGGAVWIFVWKKGNILC